MKYADSKGVDSDKVEKAHRERIDDKRNAQKTEIYVLIGLIAFFSGILLFCICCLFVFCYKEHVTLGEEEERRNLLLLQ